MSSISVRDLDNDVATRLKVQAARHGRSMEAEVRAILTDAVAGNENPRPNLAQAARERFARAGGAELETPSRTEMPRAADLPELS